MGLTGRQAPRLQEEAGKTFVVLRVFVSSWRKSHYAYPSNINCKDEGGAGGNTFTNVPERFTDVPKAGKERGK